ncbi:MAG: 16S rRNA (cytosine(1402)-N(4))-methyltransferase [Candidatus Levybacteria bacterium CG10_big_fil_rev_8_21_14_0_10_36_7]|nr:MAG: 16S rRNA (cytosine(1402)-N(4))-methyltransferase [Candidatus Levybacteria bacterium CG10_big_fil_rev_8_21_14_0_10_36_7]
MTHTAVFLEEATQALEIKQGKKYIDATYGAGGHSNRIAKVGGKVLAIDLDQNIRQPENKQILLVNGNYKDLKKIAKEHNFVPVSGILFDLGLSMNQIRESEKGFSYDKPHEILDMRLGNEGITASEYLNDTQPEVLKEELIRFSEDINAEAIAKKIAYVRSKNKIERVGDLTRIIDECVKADDRELKRTYARIFQAIRILVNCEIENIQSALDQSLNIVEKGGKIVVITFHSIEDRLVKKFGRANSNLISENRIKVGQNRKVAKFERSAALRVYTKI